MLGFAMEKRRRGNRPVPATTVSNLPIPILMDIFSRLPIKTVSICRCVSKTWLNVVSDSGFPLNAREYLPFAQEYGVQDSWTKEFVIENLGPYVWSTGLYQPIKYLQNGDVLMFHQTNALVAYSPLKKSFRYFKIKGIQSDFEAISLTPSLVSLRESLMGENLEVQNFNSRGSMSEIWEDNEALHLVEEDKTKELDPYWIGYPLI